MNKIDKRIWWVLLLVLIFAAIAALYMADQPANEVLLDQFQQEELEILNP